MDRKVKKEKKGNVERYKKLQLHEINKTLRSAFLENDKNTFNGL